MLDNGDPCAAPDPDLVNLPLLSASVEPLKVPSAHQQSKSQEASTGKAVIVPYRRQLGTVDMRPSVFDCCKWTAAAAPHI